MSDRGVTATPIISDSLVEFDGIGMAYWKERECVLNYRGTLGTKRLDNLASHFLCRAFIDNFYTPVVGTTEIESGRS